MPREREDQPPRTKGPGMSNLTALFDEDDFQTSYVTLQAPFPVMLLVKGLPYSQTFLCRWDADEDGKIDDVRVLCPKCSGVITAQVFEQGTFGVFASSLGCRACGWQSIAFGSPARITGNLKRRMAADGRAEAGHGV